MYKNSYTSTLLCVQMLTVQVCSRHVVCDIHWQPGKPREAQEWNSSNRQPESYYYVVWGTLWKGHTCILVCTVLLLLL